MPLQGNWLVKRADPYQAVSVWMFIWRQNRTDAVIQKEDRVEADHCLKSIYRLTSCSVDPPLTLVFLAGPAASLHGHQALTDGALPVQPVLP